MTGWTVQQRWEVVFDKLEEQGIDYGKICRIWPYFIRLPVTTVELYVKTAPNLDILIDELFRGAPVRLLSLLQHLALQQLAACCLLLAARRPQAWCAARPADKACCTRQEPCPARRAGYRPLASMRQVSSAAAAPAFIFALNVLMCTAVHLWLWQVCW